MEQDENTKLAIEMQVHAKAANVSVTTLGRLAKCGGDFFSRLMRGDRMWPETHQKMRDYIAENPASSSKKRADA